MSDGATTDVGIDPDSAGFSRRQMIIWYVAVAALYVCIYTTVDCLTYNRVQKAGIPRIWTIPHAEYIYENLCNGNLSLIRENHFFPIWGTAIFLALTDVGFLHNDHFLFFKLTLIVLLVVSILLGTSALTDRFGKAGLYVGSLLGLNPIYFQILSGMYDQFLFCGVVYCASMMLIKSETCTRHKRRWSLLTALVWGIGANIRSDLTYTFLLYLVLRFRGTTRAAKCRLAMSGLVFLLCLAPWAYLYYQRSGLFSLSSANFGDTAYLSLGQGSDRPWQGGDFTPWGVVLQDGWDMQEVAHRIGQLKPGYQMSSVFSDPWANKVYWGMFLEKISRQPYDYVRTAIEKMRMIVFTIPPFDPNPYLYFSLKNAPLKELLMDQMMSSTRLYDRMMVLILVYFGIHFVLSGMKYPFFHIGGFFCLTTITLCSFFHFHDRHLFALAAFQGMAFLAGLGVLYVQWKAVVTGAAGAPQIGFSALPKKVTAKHVLRMGAYLAPVVFMLLLLFQEIVLGSYRKDLVFVDHVKLWETKWQGRPAGTGWNEAGNYIFSSKGIRIDLGKRFDAQRMDISLDGNDTYRISYVWADANGNETVVAEQDVPLPSGRPRGLAEHDIQVPQVAVEAGYNTIVIKRLAGDGRYALGHLRLLE